MSLSGEWAMKSGVRAARERLAAGGFVAGTAQGARGTDRWAGPASRNSAKCHCNRPLFTLKAGGTLRRCCWEVGAAPVEAPLKGGAEVAISAFQESTPGLETKETLVSY